MQPRAQTKQWMATILCMRCAFWGCNECGASTPCCSFYLSLGFLLHAAKPYRCVKFSNQHFPWAMYLDATTSIFACATQEVWTSADRIMWMQDRAWWQSFFPASFQQIETEVCHVPLLVVSFQRLPCPLFWWGFFILISMDWKWN